jgi:hypothetical protein
MIRLFPALSSVGGKSLAVDSQLILNSSHLSLNYRNFIAGLGYARLAPTFGWRVTQHLQLAGQDVTPSPIGLSAATMESMESSKIGKYAPTKLQNDLINRHL